MNRACPWTEGDVVAIGAGMRWTLSACWSLLVRQDPSLDPSPLTAALRRLEALGVQADPERPAGPLEHRSPEITQALQALCDVIQHVRRVGAQALVAPEWHAAWLTCTAMWPRWWYRLPGDAPTGTIQLVHLGDLPAGHPALRDLDRREATQTIVGLVLSGTPLAGWSAPEAVLRLPGLLHLDISGCQLAALPDLALGNPTIEVLRLDRNPIRSLRPLLDRSMLPRLRAVGLGRCQVSPQELDQLRRARPEIAWMNAD